MGYSAPSAENVYRYVFRRDSESRSLTDGFGFSIIFVNDDSEVCRTFISRYFVDLCHRTADRIRIIFFSDLPQSDFEHLAREVFSSRVPYQNGILGAVIDSATQPRSNEPNVALLHHFLLALHHRDYVQVDGLLSRISQAFGPHYADTLYRIVREHRLGAYDVAEARAYELVLELQDRGRSAGRDPFQRMYDDLWRSLTPDALTPVDAPERTRELSFDVTTNAAMPGVGESMRFAARLGIGRYVPCCVFFTDIGELSVDVYPLEGLAPDEMYRQLRSWIDRFYEENQETIDRWNQVEKDIAEFTRSVNQPLTVLRNWLSTSDRLWKELRSIAGVIVGLSAALPKPDIYRSVIDGLKPTSWNWSWECRDILSACQTRLAALTARGSEQRAKLQRFEAIIDRLSAAAGFDQVYGALRFADGQTVAPPEFMSPNGVLRRAMNVMDAYRQMLDAPDPDPQTELLRWWCSTQRALPSRRQYERARKKWPFVTERYTAFAKPEYAALLDGILSLPFSDSMEEMAEKTRLHLARIMGVDPDSAEWEMAFAAYSDKVTPFFHALCDNAPNWIDRTAADVRVCDVLPFRSHDPVEFKAILAATTEDDPLGAMMRRAAAGWSDRHADIVAEGERNAWACRNEVLQAFVALREAPADLRAEEVAALSNCLQSVRRLRDKTEKQLADLANAATEPSNSPRVVEVDDIQRFSALLDRYERTVNDLVYPYKRDSRMRGVKLRAPIPQVLEVWLPEQTKPSDRRREELEQIARESQVGPTLFKEVRSRAQTITPVARLARAIDRTDIAIAPAEDLEVTLHGLNDYELYRAWDALAGSTRQARTRKAVIDMILAMTGVIPAGEQNLNPAAGPADRVEAQRWPAWMDEAVKPSGSRPRLDVGIVIALEEEFQELAPQIRTRPYYNPEVKQYYYLFERNATSVRPPLQRCVVTFVGSMGPVDAAIVCDRLLAQFDPATIVSIGIAGSMDKDVLVGDVIVADQTDEYMASGKAIETKDKHDWDIQLSGNPYKTDPAYVAHAVNLKYANEDAAREWQQSGKRKLLDWIGPATTGELIGQHLIGDAPKVHIGHIASGPVVGATNQFVRWLKERRDRKFVALEMESAGVLGAAHKRAVSSLIIRGVSDYSDGRKTKFDDIGKGALRRYAMNNALGMLWILMDL